MPPVDRQPESPPPDSPPGLDPIDVWLQALELTGSLTAEIDGTPLSVRMADRCLVIEAPALSRLKGMLNRFPARPRTSRTPRPRIDGGAPTDGGGPAHSEGGSAWTGIRQRRDQINALADRLTRADLRAVLRVDGRSVLAIGRDATPGLPERAAGLRHVTLAHRAAVLALWPLLRELLPGGRNAAAADRPAD